MGKRLFTMNKKDNIIFVRKIINQCKDFICFDSSQAQYWVALLENTTNKYESMQYVAEITSYCLQVTIKELELKTRHEAK